MSLSFVYLISPRTICVKRKTDPFIAFAPINDKQSKVGIYESKLRRCILSTVWYCFVLVNFTVKYFEGHMLHAFLASTICAYGKGFYKFE